MAWRRRRCLSMTHDLHQVAAGEKFGRLAMGHALLVQEHARDHDQGHVMVPRPPTADAILGHQLALLGKCSSRNHEKVKGNLTK